LPPEQVQALDDIGRLELSIGLLQKSSPELSASRTLTRRQIRGLVIASVILLVTFPLLGHNLIILIIIPIVAAYLAVLALRLILFRRSLAAPRTVVISDEEALAVPDWRLPVYTVLVPAYHEPEVMPRLVEQLRGLRYPRNRLDIKLLLEEDDEDTVQAAHEAIGADSEGIQVVLVPAAKPRAKPKALNYGLTLARGQLLTIYDAEDRPDPLQLRRAAVALGRLPDSVVCLQAKLLYFNPQQNLITRWFAIEYRMWFSQLLPGLVDFDAPVPLGGTSNHFRRQVLTDIGAWDPFNVTEDADLGIRLHRLGFRTAVLDSVTYEEANSDFVNWVRQRSRWYKGYLQTWLVNMRHPRELLRDLGWKGFLLFNLFVGGTPLLAMLNPVFWIMTVLWFITRSTLILELFPMPVYYAGLLCWLAGNFVFVYATMLSAFEDDEPKLVMAAALTPLYWVMMAVAATKAVFQIVVSPSYWEKTFHGLDQMAVEEPDTLEVAPSEDGAEPQPETAEPGRRSSRRLGAASRRALGAIRQRAAPTAQGSPDAAPDELTSPGEPTSSVVVLEQPPTGDTGDA
jgi:cellulose synthase/poly-beta-1,6-N-acetylglucosamine synthase-like glycosyltransferase